MKKLLRDELTIANVTAFLEELVDMTADAPLHVRHAWNTLVDFCEGIIHESEMNLVTLSYEIVFDWVQHPERCGIVRP